jgi:hypothetical protein
MQEQDPKPYGCSLDFAVMDGVPEHAPHISSVPSALKLDPAFVLASGRQIVEAEDSEVEQALGAGVGAGAGLDVTYLRADEQAQADFREGVQLVLSKLNGSPVLASYGGGPFQARRVRLVSCGKKGSVRAVVLDVLVHREPKYVAKHVRALHVSGATHFPWAKVLGSAFEDTISTYTSYPDSLSQVRIFPTGTGFTGGSYYPRDNDQPLGGGPPPLNGSADGKRPFREVKPDMTGFRAAPSSIKLEKVATDAARNVYGFRSSSVAAFENPFGVIRYELWGVSDGASFRTVYVDVDPATKFATFSGFL